MRLSLDVVVLIVSLSQMSNKEKISENLQHIAIADQWIVLLLVVYYPLSCILKQVTFRQKSRQRVIMIRPRLLQNQHNKTDIPLDLLLSLKLSLKTSFDGYEPNFRCYLTAAFTSSFRFSIFSLFLSYCLGWPIVWYGTSFMERAEVVHVMSAKITGQWDKALIIVASCYHLPVRFSLALWLTFKFSLSCSIFEVHPIEVMFFPIVIVQKKYHDKRQPIQLSLDITVLISLLETIDENLLYANSSIRLV